MSYFSFYCDFKDPLPTFKVCLSCKCFNGNAVELLYQLVAHCSLTLVSNSLAWDWVPVETQRLLPSHQKHQEQELRPAHSSHISSHSLELALCDGSGDESVDERDSGEQPSSWQPAGRKEKQHISRKQQFTSFIGLVVYQKLFCQNSIYNVHVFSLKECGSHIQAALRDKCVPLKT